MLSFHTGSKRSREDDSDSEGESSSQPVKRSRRRLISPRLRHTPKEDVQAIETQRSPTPPRQISDVEAMTPAQSEYNGSPELAWGGPVRTSKENDYDMDMDMDDDDLDITSQPPLSPYTSDHFMRPAMLDSSLFGHEPAYASGRIPTPMHSTFHRGGMNGLGYPASGSAGGFSVPSLQAPTSRKTKKHSPAHDRSHRMPSPISEDDEIPDTPTALTQSQLSRLSVSQADQMDVEPSPPQLAPPPMPRTRKRSGALTGQGRYIMGFRSDCEKCQQRVPGHYSHFV